MQSNARLRTPTDATTDRLSRNKLSHKAIYADRMSSLHDLPTAVLITNNDNIILFANRQAHELARTLKIPHLTGTHLSELAAMSACPQRPFTLHVMPLRDRRGYCMGAFVDWIPKAAVTSSPNTNLNPASRVTA